MRMKEFIIFLVIFTIAYIVFFIVFDKLSAISTKKKTKKHALSLIKIEEYTKFASFYGIQTTTTINTLISIYEDQMKGKNCVISEKAKLYGLSNIEYVVVVLYLEYLKLMNKKMVSLEMDLIKNTSFQEQNMVQKYNTYFNEKKSYEEIITKMGQTAENDLIMMNKNFLMPGVRLINSKLYYVGDYL